MPVWLDLEPGKRNARIFIFGMCGWVLLYGLIYHFKMKSNFLDWLYYGLIVLFVADIAVMGWTYKDYYGRSIMHELDPDDQDNWKLNKETHKYEKVVEASYPEVQIPVREDPEPLNEPSMEFDAPEGKQVEEDRMSLNQESEGEYPEREIEKLNGDKIEVEIGADSE